MTGLDKPSFAKTAQYMVRKIGYKANMLLRKRKALKSVQASGIESVPKKFV